MPHHSPKRAIADAAELRASPIMSTSPISTSSSVAMQFASIMIFTSPVFSRVLNQVSVRFIYCPLPRRRAHGKHTTSNKYVYYICTQSGPPCCPAISLLSRCDGAASGAEPIQGDIAVVKICDARRAALETAQQRNNVLKSIHGVETRAIASLYCFELRSFVCNRDWSDAAPPLGVGGVNYRRPGFRTCASYPLARGGASWHRVVKR